MYLSWRWLVFLAVIVMVSGIANAIAGNAWWALLNGATSASCAWIAIDEYEKRNRGRS